MKHLLSITLTLVILLAVSCGEGSITLTPSERHNLDSLIADSLAEQHKRDSVVQFARNSMSKMDYLFDHEVDSDSLESVFPKKYPRERTEQGLYAFYLVSWSRMETARYADDIVTFHLCFQFSRPSRFDVEMIQVVFNNSDARILFPRMDSHEKDGRYYYSFDEIVGPDFTDPALLQAIIYTGTLRLDMYDKAGRSFSYRVPADELSVLQVMCLHWAAMRLNINNSLPMHEISPYNYLEGEHYRRYSKNWHIKINR